MINGHLQEWEVWIKNPVSNFLMPISIMEGTSLILRTISKFQKSRKKKPILTLFIVKMNRLKNSLENGQKHVELETSCL